MSALMHNMNLAIAFACLILALHLFRTRPVERSTPVLLGVTFLALSVQAGLMVFVTVYGRHNLAGILMPSLALMIGPLFLFTFQSALPNFRPGWIHLPHVLPAILVLLMLTFRKVLVNIDALILMSFFVYALWLLKKVWAGRSQFEHLGQRMSVVYRWLICASVILLLAFVSELLVLAEIYGGITMGQSTTLLIASITKFCAVVYLLLSALQSPSLFDWLYEFGTQSKRASIDPEQRENWHSLASDFADLVNSQRLFVEESVSLKSIAQRLGVPARQLSEAINYEFEESFSKYMNRLRVAEAKRLLDESSAASITQVMYDSGFRTKSNFNKEFRALVGFSPTEYREQAN